MLPFCLYIFLTSSNYWKIVSFVSVIFILFNVFFLKSRSVWAGLFLATITTIILVCVLYNKLDIPKETRLLFLKRILYITIVVAIIISVTAYFHFKSISKEHPVSQHKYLFSMNHPSVQERMLMWRKSLSLTKDNLFLASVISTI